MHYFCYNLIVVPNSFLNLNFSIISLIYIISYSDLILRSARLFGYLWFPLHYVFRFKIYSDADIVLSKDWVPPITIAPTQITTNETESPARKKTNSVSFSLDSTSTDPEPSVMSLSTSAGDAKEESEKGESRKNKVNI